MKEDSLEEFIPQLRKPDCRKMKDLDLAIGALSGVTDRSSRVVPSLLVLGSSLLFDWDDLKPTETEDGNTRCSVLDATGTSVNITLGAGFIRRVEISRDQEEAYSHIVMEYESVEVA